MLFREKKIDDLIGFTEICDSEKLLSVIGSQCGPEDIPPALSDEQQEQLGQQIGDWVAAGKHL